MKWNNQIYIAACTQNKLQNKKPRSSLYSKMSRDLCISNMKWVYGWASNITHPQVSVLVLRPVSNRIDGMCQCHGSKKNSHNHVVVPNLLYDQLFFNMCGWGVMGSNLGVFSKFVIVAIKYLQQQFTVSQVGAIFERMGRFVLTPHSFPIIIISSRHIEIAVDYMISRKVQLFC